MGTAVLVGVLVMVFVGVFVGVLVAVFVTVKVGVFVGVLVGGKVPVLVAVAVGVFVGVLVIVAVGVFVGELVGVGVLGAIKSSEKPIHCSTAARVPVIVSAVTPVLSYRPATASVSATPASLNVPEVPALNALALAEKHPTMKSLLFCVVPVIVQGSLAAWFVLVLRTATDCTPE